MKKIVVFLTIAILVGMTAFVAFSSNQNRDSSSALLEVNSTYGSYYNPPTFTYKTCSGSDSEGPLWSWADSGVSYTDDGYEWETHPNNGQKRKENFPAPAGFFEHNLRWIEQPKGIFKGWGNWEYKDYTKKFAVSAYAYISCSSDNHNYETKYNLRAEVPAGFQYPNVRNPDTQTEEGAFSDYEDRSGSKNGWGHEISTNPNASASANGTNLTNEETHSTSAATPTPSTARDFDIYCGLCDDSGCDVCNPHR